MTALQQNILDGMKGAGVAVRPQKLYSDALSGAQGPAATYAQLVRHNVAAIAQALRETP